MKKLKKTKLSLTPETIANLSSVFGGKLCSDTAPTQKCRSAEGTCFDSCQICSPVQE